MTTTPPGDPDDGFELTRTVLTCLNDDGTWSAPLWEQVQRTLGQWIEIAVHRPCITLPANPADIVLALDSHAVLDKGALQFTVLPVWARPAAISHPDQEGTSCPTSSV